MSLHFEVLVHDLVELTESHRLAVNGCENLVIIWRSAFVNRIVFPVLQLTHDFGKDVADCALGLVCHVKLQTHRGIPQRDFSQWVIVFNV